ncbi:MAG: hypothetical protein U0414_01275 [Polyangiaceae bacterium]
MRSRWLLLGSMLLASTISWSRSGSTFGGPTFGEEARAQDVEIKVGADLMAIQSVSLDDAILAVGDHVSVVATQVQGGALFVDVSLADGHVVKSVPIDHIRKSFRVVG